MCNKQYRGKVFEDTFDFSTTITWQAVYRLPRAVVSTGATRHVSFTLHFFRSIVPLIHTSQQPCLLESCSEFPVAVGMVIKRVTRNFPATLSNNFKRDDINV